MVAASEGRASTLGALVQTVSESAGRAGAAPPSGSLGNLIAANTIPSLGVVGQLGAAMGGGMVMPSAMGHLAGVQSLAGRDVTTWDNLYSTSRVINRTELREVRPVSLSEATKAIAVLALRVHELQAEVAEMKRQQAGVGRALYITNISRDRSRLDFSAWLEAIGAMKYIQKVEVWQDKGAATHKGSAKILCKSPEDGDRVVAFINDTEWGGRYLSAVPFETKKE